MKNALVGSLAAVVLSAVALLSLAACSSKTAQVTDVWTAPDLTKLQFKKVLAIAAVQEDGTRRVFEDAIVTAMPGVQAVPSYRFLNAETSKDGAKVAAALKAEHFDGVVVLRLLDDRKEVKVTETMDYPAYGAYGVPYGAYGGYGYPSAYRSFGGYYGGYAMGGYGYGYPATTTTTVTTDRIYSVETNIYEFPGEKLVWTGITESTSPGNTELLVRDVAAAVRRQLISQKLIPAQPE